MVVNGPNGLDANHVPFLIGANPLWKEAQDADEALVVFRAEDAYISPNWYPSKHEFHRQVPTWNYRVVHVHGKLYIRDNGSPRPWKMTDSSPEYVDQMLSAIVGTKTRKSETA